MAKREPTHTVGGNVNWYSQCGEQHEGSWKKTKNQTTIWLSNPTPRHVSEGKHGLEVYIHPIVYCSTVYNKQDMEAA